ncbi:carboxypeptidase-like regulatory domain-containing protein [Sphingomonas glacialis]|uniref:Carboxypeptidase regulatory-like domain-containing protein n=1 Tax=Sphingomonas glacialis TaxID=658225 RepID=A0A502G3F1_9SPHN|nr:carboxypeptidase-like regulatory domain-containing protein [Sphingomonas glacialis]TPG56487.1 carboxypeptidase regulatory-like domain-containing protein [Sphingomonas glacialis]
MADPFDVPATDGVMVLPRAGMTTPVELGIVGTGSIEGKMTGAGGALAGELVELVDSKEAVIAKVRSEFDGYFIFERIRYGRYRLRLSGASAVSEADVELTANRPSSRVTLGATALAMASHAR